MFTKFFLQAIDMINAFFEDFSRFQIPEEVSWKHNKLLNRKFKEKIGNFQVFNNIDYEYMHDMSKTELIQLIKQQNMQTQLFNYVLDNEKER
jgi:hypothetical protein